MLRANKLVFVAVFALIFSLFSINWALYSEPVKESFISTSGQCIQEAPSDRLSVSFISKAENMNLKKAQDSAKKKYEELRVALKALNLKDAKVETSVYDVHENKQRENGKWVFKGYIVLMGLNVETSEIDRGGEALGAASKIGITEVGALQMFLSDEKKQSIRFNCLDVAAKDAQKKAARIAESLSVKLGPARQVTEQSSFDGYYPYARNEGRMMANTLMRESAAAPEIENQSQKLTLTLSVSFVIN